KGAQPRYDGPGRPRWKPIHATVNWTIGVEIVRWPSEWCQNRFARPLGRGSSEPTGEGQDELSRWDLAIWDDPPPDGQGGNTDAAQDKRGRRGDSLLNCKTIHPIATTINASCVDRDGSAGRRLNHS